MFQNDEGTQEKLLQQSVKKLNKLKIDDNVRVQNEETNKQDRKGTIIELGEFRKYKILLANGRSICRNRRFLRPDYGVKPNQAQPLETGMSERANINRPGGFNDQGRKSGGEETQQELGQPNDQNETTDREGMPRNGRRENPKPPGFYRRLHGGFED